MGECSRSHWPNKPGAHIPREQDVEWTPPETHGQEVEEVRRPFPPEKLQCLTEMVNEYRVVKTTGEQTLLCTISPCWLKHFFFNNPMKLLVFGCYTHLRRPVATFLFVIEEDTWKKEPRYNNHDLFISMDLYLHQAHSHQFYDSSMNRGTGVFTLVGILEATHPKIPPGARGCPQCYQGPCPHFTRHVWFLTLPYSHGRHDRQGQGRRTGEKKGWHCRGHQHSPPPSGATAPSLALSLHLAHHPIPTCRPRL